MECRIRCAAAIGVTIDPGTDFENSVVGSGRHAMSRAKNTRRATLGIDQGESAYLARIAQLEAELEAVAAELARYKALALAGGAGRLCRPSTSTSMPTCS